MSLGAVVLGVQAFVYAARSVFRLGGWQGQKIARLSGDQFDTG